MYQHVHKDISNKNHQWCLKISWKTITLKKLKSAIVLWKNFGPLNSRRGSEVGARIPVDSNGNSGTFAGHDQVVSWSNQVTGDTWCWYVLVTGAERMYDDLFYDFGGSNSFVFFLNWRNHNESARRYHTLTDVIAVNCQCSLEVLFPNLEKIQLYNQWIYVSPMHFESFQNASASPNLPCRLTVANSVVQVVRLGIMNPDDPRIRKDPDGIPHLG